jgi:hypothetical protein
MEDVQEMEPPSFAYKTFFHDVQEMEHPIFCITNLFSRPHIYLPKNLLGSYDCGGYINIPMNQNT